MIASVFMLNSPGSRRLPERDGRRAVDTFAEVFRQVFHLTYIRQTLAVARGSLMCRSLGEDAFRLKGGNVQLRILAGC